MLPAILTLQKLISVDIEDYVIFLLVDSPASPTRQPVKGSVPRMSATCGPTCLEQFEKSGQRSSWARTFAASLIGMKGWYSTRCNLTWKLKVTKSSRFYFQLAPSTLPTKGNEFGLLPTVRTTDQRSNHGGARQGPNGGFYRLDSEHGANLSEVVKLLPTPQTQGLKVCNSEGKTERMGLNLLPTPKARVPADSPAERRRNTPSMASMASMGMLPTPTVNDSKNSTFPQSQLNRESIIGSIMSTEPIGPISQLNPRFVQEMMGFPPDWTELPFQL